MIRVDARDVEARWPEALVRLEMQCLRIAEHAGVRYFVTQWARILEKGDTRPAGGEILIVVVSGERTASRRSVSTRRRTAIPTAARTLTGRRAVRNINRELS